MGFFPGLTDLQDERYSSCEMTDFPRRSAVSRLFAALALCVSLAFPNAQADQAQEIRRNETLAPGIEHLEIRRGDLTDDPEHDCWIIHVLLLDPRRARLVLARAMDEIVGAETTSSLAARHSALAAVNGGYFRTAGTYRGEPTGLLVMDRKILSEPLGRRTALAISNAGERTRLASARLEVKAEVLVEGGKTYPVSGFNRPREADELIVFTPEFHRTTLAGPNGLEAVVEGGRIITVGDGAGSQTIPRGGYVLSADGRQPKKSVGMTIGELAVLMTGLGCVEAINLDGGGSTTMVINNRVVNNPSDAAGERPVSDALLVFPRK